MVTRVGAATGVLVMVNAGESVAPAGTVTVAGTAATAGLPLDKLTTAPAGVAGPVSASSLLLVEPPPSTDWGDNVTDASRKGYTVRVAVLVTP